MLTLMDDMPEGTLGIVADGIVTAKDYENVLIPAVNKMLEKQDKVRALYVTAPDFTGYDAGAMWDDAKVGFAHLTAWERIAIVTDVEWLRMMVSGVSFLMMGHVRLFKGDEIDAAKAWVLE